MDLANLAHEHFTGLLHERFRVQNGGAVVELELVEVTKLGNGSKGRRDPFSLIFRGPGDVTFPQGIHSLQGSAPDALEIFLVPIGRGEDGTGMLYQAVFT